MKAQVKTPIVVVIVVVVLGAVIFFGMKQVGNAGGLDHGQIQYTPGTPPWKETDPNKKGPGGLGSRNASTQAPGAPGAGAPVGPANVDNTPH